jgi:integrase
MSKMSEGRASPKKVGSSAPKVVRRHRVIFNPNIGAEDFKDDPQTASAAREEMVELSVRASTRKQYESRLRVLGRWLAARGKKGITKALFFLFLRDLRSQGISDLGCFRAAVLFCQKKKGFRLWAADRDVVAASSPAEKPGPRQEKGSLTIAMFQQLLTAAGGRRKLRLAIICMKIGRLRINELSHLRKGDFQRDEGGNFLFFIRSDKRHGHQEIYTKPAVGTANEIEEMRLADERCKTRLVFPNDLSKDIRDLLGTTAEKCGWPSDLHWHATHTLRITGSKELREFVGRKMEAFEAAQSEGVFGKYARGNTERLNKRQR